MNSTSQNVSGHNSISGAVTPAASNSAEATLRLIARLPAPKGLEDRVLAGLKSAPRSGRILYWPAMQQATRGWMRGAAAAAIVFVVAGGGWGIYTHVQPAQPAGAIVMPSHAGAAGGFSSAGAMRTPQTLNGPVVAHPATAQPAQTKPLKKAPALVATTPRHKSQRAAANKVAGQPDVTVAK
jgi:hypothetical protein